MQNLVTSPIQPLQGLPFTYNRDYLNTAPSSSTHNASDSHDGYAKKGKRNRTMDSDSEVEKEKRRRGKDDNRSSGIPSTSRSNTHSSSNSDGFRSLFGGGSERKEVPDKGISPDSGVHSAENDPGDENDVHSAQTIINLITKLSPPLSPIKERPSDKKAERERREAELREKERKAKEREEAERRERMERERREKEERERQEIKQAEPFLQAARVDGLRGEIPLKGLDRSKLNQLLEIGRRTGRLKEDRKEASGSKEERRKEKKEREKKSKDRLTVEDALRKEKESSARSSPCLPRASSSQSHDEQSSSHSRPSSAVSNHPSRNNFECLAHEFVPVKPARPVKPEEGSTVLLYDFYHSVAKSRKRKGDAETDRVGRILLYLDATAYFVLSAKHFNPPDAGENRANYQYSIIHDTNDLLNEKKPKDVTSRKDRSLERKEKPKPADLDKSKFSTSERKRDDSAPRVDGLRGEIPLKGLDRSKLNQLLEIGRRTGRLKEDRKEASVSKEERRKEKKEREKKSKDRLTVEDALRKEKESSARSSPCLPRASSSQSHDEQSSSHSRPSSAVSNHPSRNNFECLAHEFVPVKPARPVKPEEGSTVLLYDFYHSVAKSRKRKGDAETDRVGRILLYLDATAYFVLSAKHFNPPDAGENRANYQYSIIHDTNDLLKRVTNSFLSQTDGCSPLQLHMSSRIRNLSWRCQACLLFHLYNFRSHNALKTYGMISQMEAQIQEESQAQNGSSAHNTSSPGSSVHSNSNQSTTVVTMPGKVYEVQRQQLKTLHQLMFAHRMWQNAAKVADISRTDMTFIGGLEKVCGALFLDAALDKVAAYVLTGVACLKGEYEREKASPPQPAIKRSTAPS
ncbi:hypothetical protein OESDEN_05116 [Oesophagostomum dentatum]|uniref:AF4/FMR2 family member lilli n=1 Tax=Oesophagostomum dentatum TaxID=61180 RepID=A0A0B1TCD4_OESDE|nr:hypothetical protein OESDEN_05116 [Oesophagostomum dentatum]